jgi:hypothetical protein
MRQSTPTRHLGSICHLRKFSMNGIAERKNRHLLEVARSMMIAMNVSKYLWGQAVLIATFLSIGCPHESWSGRPHFRYEKVRREVFFL